MLEGNEQIYTLREPGHLEELIPVPAASPQQLEVSSCPSQEGLISPSREPLWAVSAGFVPCPPPPPAPNCLVGGFSAFGNEGQRSYRVWCLAHAPPCLLETGDSPVDPFFYCPAKMKESSWLRCSLCKSWQRQSKVEILP